MLRSLTRAITRVSPTASVPLARPTMMIARQQRRTLADAAPAKAAAKDASSGYLNFRFTSPTTTYYADKPVYMV
jgi:hypothetical protein